MTTDLSPALLRRAATHLRDPYLCNRNPHVELAVADLLDLEADAWDEYGTPRAGIVGVARAALRNVDAPEGESR